MSEIGGTLTEVENVFRIPSQNLGELKSKLAKLNKRAAKLGTAPIALTVLSTEIVEEKQIPSDLSIGYDPTDRMSWPTVAREWNTVQIDGETPMLNGWQFVATLVHGENGTIINRVPTFDTEVDLTIYRDADASHCDHCGLDRRRKDTFVVYNAETGETKQIGRQCLKDFLGYNDPMAIAAQLERIRELMGSLNDDEREGYSYNAVYDWSVVGYLSHVAACVRNYGWLAASAASYDETPTSAKAWNNLMNYGKTDSQGRKLYVDVEAQDTELAEKAQAWNELDWSKTGNEFEGNMAVAFASPYFNARVKGFVAYGLQAYLKATTEQIEREAKATQAPSEWQGEVGKREVFEGLTVSSENVIDRYGDGYQITYLYTMVDSAGSYFKWFASNPKLEVGQTYNLKATVKKHDEYKGQKQTVITRATEV